MVAAMLLGGLRRNEVLSLRFCDLHAGERRVFVVDGKGGHQRMVPMPGRFFTTLAAYHDGERRRRRRIGSSWSARDPTGADP